MMIMRNFLFPTILLSLGCATPGYGQVSYDQTTGRYTVMVYNDDDQLVPMTFASPGRVRLETTGTVTSSGGGRFHYRWVARVSPDSPDPLGTLWIPCPEQAQIDTMAFVTTRTRGRWIAGVRHQGEDRPYCQFFWRVDTRDSVVVDIVSDRLPAFGELRAQGFTRGASWPTSDPNASNDDLVGVVDSLLGLSPSGVHVPVATVVPTRAPSETAEPMTALASMQADLQLACTRGWISPRGVCRSLEAKLTSVARDLGRNDLSAARAHLAAFRQELSNLERNHLSPEAASVLGIAAAVLASRIN